MKNLKIKTRLTLTFLIFIFLVFFSCITSDVLIQQTSSEKDRIFDEYGRATEKMIMAYADYEELKFLLRNMIYVHEFDDAARADDITKIANTIETMTASAEEFKTTTDLDNEEIKKQYEIVEKELGVYVNSVNSCVQSVSGGDFQAAKDLLVGEIIDQALALDTEINKLVDLVDTEAYNASDEVMKDVKGFLWFTGIVGVFSIIFGIVADVTCQTAIRTPIRLLLAELRKLEKGDINVNVQKLNNDEIGELIDGFNQLVETTKEQAYVASEVAEGNLTVKVTPRSPQDVLGNALARLVSENNKVLSNIYESSSQVTTGSEQVASASQSLAQGSTEQASAIEQITASINEIADRTRKNAEQANEANDLVVSAKEEAEKGNSQMQGMIAAMTEINESSENISKIIKVIDDIAFQTNILALNAAVEAARAGSHGKGFAVVAEEVRNLAGKSASAASETAEMIEDSIRKVVNGSALATETAEALEEIVQAVEQIVEIISNIAAASNEQATAVAQIDQAINQVSQVVQTNSATSEQCAAASEELSNQSVRLREMINRFRLQDTDSYYGGYDASDYSYSASDSVSRTISLGDGFDKY